MKILSSFLFCLPLAGICQSGPTTLEVQMFNHDKVVVCIDGKQFNKCSKFKLTNLKEGNHQLKVFKPKQYINPMSQKVTERLIPIYTGTIFLVNEQKTNCIINEFHQKTIEIKRG